ncbi:MAG: DUF4412 domain-containing protein, partial [Bacteroidota bacterium]
MSKLINRAFLFLFVFGTAINVQAQKQLDKGTLVFEITEAKADDEQMNAQMGMVKGGKTTIIFEGEQQRMDVNMMGGMVNMKTLSEKDGGAKMIMDMMGQKILINVSKEEQEASTPEFDYDIKKDESDTKEILGYKCVKYTIKQTGGGMNIEMEAYVTDQIKTQRSIIDQAKGLDLDGTPLQYTVHNMGMHITTLATDIKDTIEENAFNPSTEGYKE